MRVRPITRDDHPEVTAITSQSFRDDGFYAWLWPNQEQYPNDLRRYQSIRLRIRLVGLGQLGFVVVTEDGDRDWSGKPEVVGFAYMVRRGDDEGAKQWRTDSLFNKLERKLLGWELWYESTFLDRVTDHANMKAHLTNAPGDYLSIIDQRWHLAIIAVSPKHQRRGLGSILVGHAQKIAAEEGVPLTLEASIVGKGAYLKNGFKVVKEFDVCDGFVDTLMVWEPEPLRGKWLKDFEGDWAKVKDKDADGGYTM